MTTLRIVIVATFVGLVSFRLLSHTHYWANWAVVIVALVGVVVLHLGDRHKAAWLQRAERLDAEPASAPVADADLPAGLVEPNPNEHITRLNPKDDESIRRA